MAAFWTAFFEGTESVPLLIQALEEVPGLGATDLGDGTHALSAWLEGWAQRGFAAEWEHTRQLGRRTRIYPDPWTWRSPWCPPEEVSQDLPADQMALVSAFLGKALSPAQRLRSMPCDGVELAFRRAIPNLFQALVASPDGPSLEDLEARRVTAGGWSDLPWLLWAAQMSDPAFLLALLSKGMNPHVTNERGENALFFARTHVALQALLNAGTLLDQLSHAGLSAQAHWFSPQGLMRSGPLVDSGAWVGKAAHLVLGMARFATHEEEWQTVERIASGFVGAGFDLPSYTVTARNKPWPLATFLAQQGLRQNGRIQSFRPLVMVASTQGFLQDSGQETLKGCPDQGWLFLALLYRLSKDCSAQTPRDVAWWDGVDPLIGKGLAVGSDWWQSSALLKKALVLSQRTLKQAPLRSGISGAWGTWFERVFQAWEHGSRGPAEEVVCAVLDDLVRIGVRVEKSVVLSFLTRCPGQGRLGWHLIAALPSMGLSMPETVGWAARLAEASPPPMVPPLKKGIVQAARGLLPMPSDKVAAHFKALALSEGLPAQGPSRPRGRF